MHSLKSSLYITHKLNNLIKVFLNEVLGQDLAYFLINGGSF